MLTAMNVEQRPARLVLPLNSVLFVYIPFVLIAIPCRLTNDARQWLRAIQSFAAVLIYMFVPNAKRVTRVYNKDKKMVGLKYVNRVKDTLMPSRSMFPPAEFVTPSCAPIANSVMICLDVCLANTIFATSAIFLPAAISVIDRYVRIALRFMIVIAAENMFAPIVKRLLLINDVLFWTHARM